MTRTGGSLVFAQRTRRACDAALQHTVREARLPRWLSVARDCLGVQTQDAARTVRLRDASTVRARDAPAVVAAAAPLSDAAGVVAAASSRDGSALDAQRIDVEALMGRDGSIDSKGLCAEVGVIYGSPQAVAPHAMFEPIDIDAFLFDGAHESALRLRTYAVCGARDAKRVCTVPPCTVPRTPLTRRWRGVPRREYVCAYVHGWLLMDTGVAVVVGRIGARKPTPLLRNMYCGRSSAVYATTPSYGCLDGSLLNGVFALAGEEVAGSVKNVVDAHGVWGINLATLDVILQKVEFKGVRCRVRRAPKSARAAMNSCDRRSPIRWLASVTRDVYIVHLRIPRISEHAVVVDGIRGQIIDVVEERPVHLTVDTLEMCSGAENAGDVIVAGIRLLELY
eukprot:IDg22146t1